MTGIFRLVVYIIMMLSNEDQVERRLLEAIGKGDNCPFL